LAPASGAVCGAARKTPPGIGRTLRHVASRLGRQKTARAVAHTSLVLLSPGRLEGTCDEAARADRHEAREEEGDKKRAMAALERVGYEVALSPMTDMSSLWTSCMNGLDERGITREGLQRGRLLSSQTRGDVVLWRLQRRALEPCHRVVESAPDVLARVELGAGGREEDQAHVFRHGESLGRMRPAVVQEQEMQAVRDGGCEGVAEELDTVDGHIRQLQGAPVTCRGLHGPLDVEPCEDLLDGADGLPPRGGQTAAADGQSPNATFVLAEDSDGACVGGWEGLLPVSMTAGLEGGHRCRGFLCGWGAAP
jgi:hypothetical protein